MSNTVLSDNGPFLAMKEGEAIDLFNEIATLEIELAREAAMAQLRIDKITNDHNKNIAERVKKRNNLAKKLNGYINAHKELFQKPRAKTTAKGSFGLRTAAGKLEIADEAKVIAYSDEHGLQLYKKIKKIDGKELKAYLENLPEGEPAPKGVTFEKGETTFYKVEKKLLEEAARVSID